MADWSALTRGFQQGADWRQQYRANKQFERAREQALETGEFGLEGKRRTARTAPPGELGAGYQAPDPWSQTLRDPFGERLWGKFKNWMQERRAARSAIPTASPADPAAAPVATAEPSEEVPSDGMMPAGEQPSGAVSFPVPDYADGGDVKPEGWRNMSAHEKAKYLAEKNRARSPGSVSSATTPAQGADRSAARPSAARRAIDATKETVSKRPKYEGAGVQKAGGVKPGDGLLRRGMAGVKGTGVGLIAGAAGSGAWDAALEDDPTARHARELGLENPDSIPADSLKGMGVNALGVLSDVGRAIIPDFIERKIPYMKDRFEEQGEPAAADTPMEEMGEGETPQAIPTGGSWTSSARGSASAAPPRQAALPSTPAEEPLDFSQLDIDPREIPNMQTDDWKRYRREMVQAAQASGDPDAVQKVDQQVTAMQQRGFLNYAQQGFALQQAGNLRGAMAAYRAAYQYFPTGFDVEFGVMPGRGGQKVIVGVGINEKTGKVEPGTQMVMDPERVSTLIENFSNPQAFRMWAKDWRDHNTGETHYNETTKPLAQAQADYLSAQAADRWAEAMNGGSSSSSGGAGGGLSSADRRAAEKTFRDRLGMLGLQDEAQADYLASVMSMVKVMNPQVPDNTIVQAIMQAQRDGTLEQRLKQMGVAPAQSASGVRPSTTPTPRSDSSPRPRQALPAGAPSGGAATPDNPNMSPERLAEYDKYAR